MNERVILVDQSDGNTIMVKVKDGVDLAILKDEIIGGSRGRSTRSARPPFPRRAYKPSRSRHD